MHDNWSILQVVDEYFPTGHNEHDDIPILDWKVFAGQQLQLLLGIPTPVEYFPDLHPIQFLSFVMPIPV